MFEADNGTIEIPVDPQRIAAQANAVGPILNLGIEPVGVTALPFFSDTEGQTSWFTEDETAAYKAATTFGAADVDFEALAALKPDLIVITVPQAAYEKNVAPVEERYQSIAPTVFIANAGDGRTVDARIADAVGRSDVYEPMRQGYDALLAEMKEEFASEVESLSFVQLSRWANTPAGTVIMQSPMEEFVDVGFEFGECPEIFCEMSMEQLSELGEYDVIIYPVGPDGEPTEDFLPVIESNVWKSLPQVMEGRALGVKIPTTLISYKGGEIMLTSLSEGLRGLPD